MKTARVLITTECNLKCEYCCNKIPEIQESIKMTTMDQFIQMSYDTVNISGGEPMMTFSKLKTLLYRLDGNSKIYLYTNGFGAEKCVEVVGKLDGVNIGYHSNFDDTFENAKKWKKHIKNVIFHYQIDTLTHGQIAHIQAQGIKTKTWILNDCNNTEEDRWII